MGYYANGKGNVTFREVLSEEKYNKAKEILSEAFECDGAREFRMTKSAAQTSYFDFWNSEKYYGDEVERALRDVAGLGEIAEGELEYVGEDDSLWRFIYRNDSWIEENGSVVYPTTNLSYERLLQVCQAYISQDAEATESDYVIGILRDQCGCSDLEIEDLGFGYLLDLEKAS